MFPPLPVLLLHADPAASLLQAWIGPQDPAPFVQFAAARREALTAGAQEPHRTWLLGLLKGPDPHLQAWAATRLVEAGASLGPDASRANGCLLDACVERFRRQVIDGNLASESANTRQEDPPPAWGDLGAIAYLEDAAPCWGPWRAKLAETKRPAVPLGFYYLFAPHLKAEDGPWVRAAFTAAVGRPLDEPWQSLAFLLATDWMMLYGQAADWQPLLDACTAKAWRRALEDLREEVGGLPLYRVEVPPPERIPGVYVPPHLIRTTFLQPDYPSKASNLGFSTDTGVLADLDAQGRVLALRLKPGPALGLFGPNAIRWAVKWKFEPAKVNLQPVPSRIRVNVRFTRRR